MLINFESLHLDFSAKPDLIFRLVIPQIIAGVYQEILTIN